MFFTEITTNQQRVRWKVNRREQSSFLEVLALDVTYLYPSTPADRSLFDLIDDAHCKGLQRFNQVLLTFKADTTRGCSLKLVTVRHMPFKCPLIGCMAKFAEQKEVNKHVQKSHTMGMT
jgi:hypothetical protein